MPRISALSGIFFLIVGDNPDDSAANYQCAWSHDTAMGASFEAEYVVCID